MSNPLIDAALLAYLQSWQGRSKTKSNTLTAGAASLRCRCRGACGPADANNAFDYRMDTVPAVDQHTGAILAERVWTTKQIEVL